MKSLKDFKTLVIYIQESKKDCNMSVLNRNKITKSSAVDFTYFKESGLYDTDQLETIETAFEFECNPTDIILIANPDFSYKRMLQIRDASIYGLTHEQVKAIASPEYDMDVADLLLSYYTFGMEEDSLAKELRKYKLNVNQFPSRESKDELIKFKNTIRTGRYFSYRDLLVIKRAIRMGFPKNIIEFLEGSYIRNSERLEMIAKFKRGWSIGEVKKWYSIIY